MRRIRRLQNDLWDSFGTDIATLGSAMNSASGRSVSGKSGISSSRPSSALHGNNYYVIQNVPLSNQVFTIFCYAGLENHN